MKIIITLLCLLSSHLALANWHKEATAILKEYNYACKSVEIKIDQIVRNEFIAGHVVGLPTEGLEKFKMVFYVKTNRWYVHPYAYYDGQEEGHSYAHLNEKGEFKIQTLRRSVPAKKIVAMLVPRPVPIKDQGRWLRPLLGIFGGVLKYDCSHLILPGNGDFK